MGIDTFAYSNFPKKAGNAGKNFPNRTPDTMHKNTHTDKYFSKKLMPSSF
jgi:hypothetical protein